MKGNLRLIQSVQRAIDIINCFDESNSKLTVNQISNKLALHVNTTRGIVNTLVYNGYLIHNIDEGNYSLGYVFIPKAELVDNSYVDRMKSLARPHLRAIANSHQVSSRLQLVSNYNVFTVDTFNPENSRYLLLTKMNTSFPLNATSSGKLFLSYQDNEFQENYLSTSKFEKYTSKTIVDRESLQEEIKTIRSKGYSLEDEEISIGMSSIAVPILSNPSKIMGTLSIVASKSFLDDIKNEVLSDLFTAADEIIREWKSQTRT
ncbi:IclR family transcriptional regulator [Gudongella sp. SC589]|uniref:IclR family transcriptional regulator n=1 Tax=Gudongella sp. SC589 TaxID=3385990 RepID=UPI003904E195